MSYAIIRNEKYKRKNLKGIYRHNERRNKNYSNKNIDKDKSHLNYSLKDCKHTYEKEFDLIKEKYNLKEQIKTVSNIACKYIIYERHLSPSVIANSLKVSKAYVTKVINKDSRYNTEKLQGRKNNKIKRNEKNKIYMRTKRNANQDICLKTQHNKDAIALSEPKKEISDEEFVKHNLSIYSRDKNGDLVATKKAILTYDVPLKLHCKRTLPTQHYIKQYYGSI